MSDNTPNDLTNSVASSASDFQRLLRTLAFTIERISKRYAIPESDMDKLVLTTVAQELFRSSDSARLQEIYIEGRDLERRLLCELGEEELSLSTRNLDDIPRGPRGGLPVSDKLMAELKGDLSRLVAVSDYPHNPSATLREIISAVSAWEYETLKLPGPPRESSADLGEFQTVLEASAHALGGRWEEARVEDAQTIEGGFANHTTMFKLRDAAGVTHELVARAETGLQFGIEGRDIAGEYHLLRYLFREGVTVAEPVWLDGSTDPRKNKFFVSRKVKGQNFGTVVAAQRLGREQLRALAQELVKIHSLNLCKTDLDLLNSHIDTSFISTSTKDAVADYLRRWTSLWDSTGLANSPTISAAGAWLRANLPDFDGVPVLVHGDYALHNIMMEGDRICGVLDWEMSHMGHRVEDICAVIASLSDPEDGAEFISHYVDCGGQPVTRFEIEYCNVFRYFAMYVVMLESDLIFRNLPNLHPELFVLGSYVQAPAARIAEVIERAERSR